MNGKTPRGMRTLIVATALAVVLIAFLAAWRVVTQLGATVP
jgi:hypothetical protein